MTKVIDFRTRPNTEPFMGIYNGSNTRDPWKKFRTIRPEMEDLETYVGRLSSVGVSVGVFTGRQGVLAGDHPISNDYIAQCVMEYPDSIRGFAGIDPRDTTAALAEIGRSVAELKLSGIALDPPSEINGDGPSWDSEEMMFPIYERASQLGVPVILTVGPVVGRHGRADVIDRAAAAFPELQIICSHGVWPQTQDLIALAFRRPNVILETSIYIDYPGAAQLIVEAANTIIPDQIVYASAFPFTPLEGIKQFRDLGFTEEALHAVCYGNGARILGMGE